MEFSYERIQKRLSILSKHLSYVMTISDPAVRENLLYYIETIRLNIWNNVFLIQLLNDYAKLLAVLSKYDDRAKEILETIPQLVE